MARADQALRKIIVNLIYFYLPVWVHGYINALCCRFSMRVQIQIPARNSVLKVAELIKIFLFYVSGNAVTTLFLLR